MHLTPVFALKYSDGRLEISALVSPNKTFNFFNKFRVRFKNSYYIISGVQLYTGVDTPSTATVNCFQIAHGSLTSDTIFVSTVVSGSTNISSAAVMINIKGFWK